MYVFERQGRCIGYSEGLRDCPHFSLTRIGPESDTLLRNLFEHYVHDMTEWFEIDTRPDGSYSYDTAQIWEKGYDVYLARWGESIAGFAVVAPAAPGEPAHDVREFFILRRFRRSGLGRRMAETLWREHPGTWQVRVLAANSPAVSFWRTAIASHTGGDYQESETMIAGRSWRFFRFVSGAV